MSAVVYEDTDGAERNILEAFPDFTVPLQTSNSGVSHEVIQDLFVLFFF